MLRELFTRFDRKCAQLLNRGEEYSVHMNRTKSKFELFLLSCCVCGIEFCYAAETAFVSPKLMSLGLPVAWMTTVWCLSPMLGFVLCPLLGSLSDACTSSIGRRRPFILLLSLGIVLGLVLVPNGREIASLFEDQHTWTIVLTVIGVVLLDLCCDACQSPARTYLLDVTTVEQHASGLSTFTIAAGLGNGLGRVVKGT